MTTDHLHPERRHNKAQRNAKRPALAVGKPLPITRPKYTNKAKGYFYL